MLSGVGWLWLFATASAVTAPFAASTAHSCTEQINSVTPHVNPTSRDLSCLSAAERRNDSQAHFKFSLVYSQQ